MLVENRTRALALAVLLLPFAAPSAQESAPESARFADLVAAKDASTWSDYHADREHLIAAALLAEYRAEAESPDPDAEDVVRRFATFLESAKGRDHDRCSVMLQEGRRLLHRGCDQPIVRLALATVALQQQGDADDALETELLRAEKDLASASPAVRFFAAWWVERHFRGVGKDDVADAAHTRATDRIVECAADPAFAGRGQRTYYWMLAAWLGRETAVEDEPLVQRIVAVPGAHRYPVLLLEGMLERAKAWKARGGGYADTVGDDAWQAFSDHMTAAGKRFVEAYRLHPDFPEAPTMMIEVSRCLDGSDDDLHGWFLAAVAGQIDFDNAYSELSWFTMPRWGGSLVTMMSYAREWAASERYDTAIPDRFRAALSRMAMDCEDPSALLSNGVVRKTLDRVHAGYLAAARTLDEYRAEQTKHVAMLEMAGRVDEAAHLCQSMEGGFMPAAFDGYRVDAGALRKRLEAHFAPHVPIEIASLDVFAGWENARFSEKEGAKPLPTGTDTPTRADWSKRYRAWLTHTAMVAYRDHGHRDNRWNDAARKMLEGYDDVVFGDAGEDRIHEIFQRAKRIVAVGCDDPLVLYVGARYAAAAGEPATAHELTQRAVDGFAAETGYPDLFACVATQYLQSLLVKEGDADAAAALKPRIAALAVAMADDACFAGDDQRFYVLSIVPSMEIGWSLSALTDEQGARLAEMGEAQS